jgi:hypothetical protein
MPETVKFKSHVLMSHLMPTKETNRLIKEHFSANQIEKIIAKNSNVNYCVKCVDMDMYNKFVKLCDGICAEFIEKGKPCYFYLDFDMKSSNDKTVIYKDAEYEPLNLIDDEINDMPFVRDYTWTYCMRDVREVGNGIFKHSYHIIFDLVVKNNTVIKQFLIDCGYNNKENNIWDLAVYADNQKFCGLYCTKSNEIPVFQPGKLDWCVRINFPDYFITDVEPSKTIEDLPFKKKPVKKVYPEKTIKESTTENTNKLIKQLTPIIEKLSVNRCDNYETWMKVVFSIINICYKEGIDDETRLELIELWSKRSAKYDEIGNEKLYTYWFENRREEGLGWTYLNNCLKEDNPEYYEKNKLKTFGEVKKEFEKNNCKILEPPCFLTIDREGNVVVNSKTNFYTRNEHIQFGDKANDADRKLVPNEKPFVEIWMKTSDIRRYDKMVFKPPPLINNEYDYNTWRGFKMIEDVKRLPSVRNYWEEYKNYAINLFGDEKIAMFILARYAYRVQKPAYRSYVCLIIYGQEGDGKNMFLKPIYKIFDNLALELDNTEKLYEKHSELENSRLLSLINEAGGNANFKNADVLKSRITDNELWVNPKGAKAYKVDNRCDYDMTTNNKCVANITNESTRRWLQVETTQHYSGNVEFFNDYMNNIVDNQQALRQIYDGLLTFDINKYVQSGNFQKDKPETEVMEEVKEQTKDKILCFIEDMVYNYEGGDDEVVKTNAELFRLWSNWKLHNDVKLEYNSINFGCKFSDICKKVINKKADLIEKKAHYRVFKMKELREALNIDVEPIPKYTKPVLNRL